MASIVKSLRVLGDSNRLRMLLLLAREELSVAELQEILGMGQSTISTHLAQLKHAGLVEDRRAGKNIWYRSKSEGEVCPSCWRCCSRPRKSSRKPQHDQAALDWCCASGRIRPGHFLMTWRAGWGGSMFPGAPGRVLPRRCYCCCRPWSSPILERVRAPFRCCWRSVRSR